MRKYARSHPARTHLACHCNVCYCCRPVNVYNVRAFVHDCDTCDVYTDCLSTILFQNSIFHIVHHRRCRILSLCCDRLECLHKFHSRICGCLRSGPHHHRHHHRRRRRHHCRRFHHHPRPIHHPPRQTRRHVHYHGCYAVGRDDDDGDYGGD